MRVNVSVHASRTTTTMSATVNVELRTDAGYGRAEPVVGTVDKAISEGRKTAIAVLQQPVQP
jgi:hypothetical protein